MSSNLRLNRRSFLERVAGSTAALGGGAFAVSGCATGRSGYSDNDPTDRMGHGRYTDSDPTDGVGHGRHRAEEMARRNGPGFDNIRGWNGSAVSFPASGPGTAAAVDISGEVGSPVSVGAPTASCRPGSNWGMTAAIVSGSLPPGVTLAPGGAITGIARERGHWIVGVTTNSLTCNGTSYNGFQQELRFHITGSGQVHS